MLQEKMFGVSNEEMIEEYRGVLRLKQDFYFSIYLDMYQKIRVDNSITGDQMMRVTNNSHFTTTDIVNNTLTIYLDDRSFAQHYDDIKLAKLHLVSVYSTQPMWESVIEDEPQNTFEFVSDNGPVKFEIELHDDEIHELCEMGVLYNLSDEVLAFRNFIQDCKENPNQYTVDVVEEIDFKVCVEKQMFRGHYYDSYTIVESEPARDINIFDSNEIILDGDDGFIIHRIYFEYRYYQNLYQIDISPEKFPLTVSEHTMNIGIIFNIGLKTLLQLVNHNIITIEKKSPKKVSIRKIKKVGISNDKEGIVCRDS